MEIFDIITFNYEYADPVASVGETYEEVARLTTPSREAGVYLYCLSMRYTYDHSSSSAYFRFSVDGGSTWTEMVKEPADTTDAIFVTYNIPVVATTQRVHEVIVEAHKSAAAPTLSIEEMTLCIERKA